MKNNISRAVILTAGLGNRLKPLTNEMPKCLTEVNNKPILEHTLQSLMKYGIKDIIIVVGYLGKIIVEKFGEKYGDLKITYRWNKIYEKTNSMYSLWLAKDYLEKGTIVIEGDILFEKEFLEKVIETPKNKSYWMLDKFDKNSQGSMSITDSNNRIIKLLIVKNTLKKYCDNFFKSTGVLKITSAYGKQFSKWLTKEVENKNTNIYYDLVIAKHLNDMPIYAKNIENKKWFELDDINDVKKAEKIFQPKKYVVIIIDGAADSKIPQLNNKTPLETANIATINFLASKGKIGLIQTIPNEMPINSIIANMEIMGFNSARYYPFGRSSFEAIAKHIFLSEEDLVLKCNLISLDKNRKIKDFTGGFISDEKAIEIIGSLQIEDDNIEIYAGQRYMNLLVFRNANCFPLEIKSYEPHLNLNTKIDNIMLKSLSNRSQQVVNKLNTIMKNSIEQIKNFNKKHKTCVDMIWLWSPSVVPKLPSFTYKFGIKGAVVAGLDFMKGIALASNMTTAEIHGATGFINTNLNEKLKYAKNFLQYNDIVFIYINAPDEESHLRNIAGKISAIEKIDKEIVAPLIEFLESHYSDNYRIAILPNHYTSVINGQHTNNPVPYLIYGKGIPSMKDMKFNEVSVKKTVKKIIKGKDFIKTLLSD